MEMCRTCDVTINGDGSVSHESDCLAQAHEELKKKHKNLLEKIGHALKEAGIAVIETAGNAIGPGVPK